MNSFVCAAAENETNRTTIGLSGFGFMRFSLNHQGRGLKSKGAKSQIPKSKSQKNPKLQNLKWTESGLVGIWDFFGIFLGFGF